VPGCDAIASTSLCLLRTCPSEQKLEQFLTALAKTNISASTQNQAFNAVISFYNQVLGTE